MRKLMLFSVGFTCACAIGVYCLSGFWYVFLGLLCLLSGLVLWLLKKRPAKIAAVILLGCTVGFSWIWGYDSFYLSTPRSYDQQTHVVTIVAADYSYKPVYGQAFDGRIELDDRTYQVRCYINEERSLMPGDSVCGEFLLRFTGPGGERESAYHQGRGIFLMAYQKGDITFGTEPIKLRDYPAVWRQKILSCITEIFPADTAGFAKALLLGESSELTYAQDRSFQISGIRHVIAVSGLHVSILYGFVYMFFGDRRLWNVLLGFPLLFLFAAVAGFTPSIVRACVMQALFILVLFFNREEDPLTALAFSALLLLAINPMTITSVSFQLSASCTLGILLFGRKLKDYILSFGKLRKKGKGKSRRAKFVRWFTGCISVTLSAMVFTTPLCAAYFGLVSLIGLLTNLLTLWIVSTIFYGIMIACGASVIWLPLGKWIAWLIAWPIRYVMTVAGVLSKFPLAAVYTDSIYIVCWLILSYVLLIAFFALKKKNPGLTAACIAVSLCVCLTLSWIEPRMDDVRISVIDVGQGQSILLQSGKERYLVDCGSEEGEAAADITANFLLSQGIFRLDGIILTHYDTDHASGVTGLLESIRVDHLYLPDTVDSNGMRDKILAVAGEKINWIQNEGKIILDRGNITLYPGNSYTDDNESSVCVLFQSQNCDILITGDRNSQGERKLLKAAEIPDLEILIAGHHGSKHATSMELLQATRPELVIISVGANNRYGHPTVETLERLELYECEVYRTDLSGTIIFRR